jgi:thiamine biosynthesis lipoprotein
VVRLWRHARRTGELPDAERLARARELVGYEKITLNKFRRTVKLAKPDMRLDLGGIAKGYAAAEALAVLKSRGFRSAMVVGGGEISVGLPPPGENGWKIGVAALDPSDRSAMQYLLLENTAVSTSGDSEQHVEIAGVRYSHVVDPHTGMAVTGRTSVTVVSPDGARADGLATALSVLEPVSALKLTDSLPDVSVYYVKSVADGEYIFATRSWHKLAEPFSTERMNK